MTESKRPPWLPTDDEAAQLTKLASRIGSDMTAVERLHQQIDDRFAASTDVKLYGTAAERATYLLAQRVAQLDDATRSRLFAVVALDKLIDDGLPSQFVELARVLEILKETT